MIDSFMRKIAYNDFINFYKFLIFSKEKPFSTFPVQTELKNIREGFL